MKTSIRLGSLAGLWVAFCALVLGPDTLKAGSKPQGAEVRAVEGTASYHLPGGPEVKIKPGTRIPAGAVVTTGPGSSVQVFFGRNTGVVRLGQESSLKIHTIKSSGSGSEIVTETHIELQKGEISGNVNKQTEGSSFVVTLPDGTVNVKQSQFVVSNRGVDAINESPAGRSSPESTQSTVRILSGQAEFSQGGTTHQFDGPSEFNPGAGSNNVVPLSPETVKEISVVVPDSKPSNNNNNNSAPQQFANVQPIQLQEVPLSPTQGNSN